MSTENRLKSKTKHYTFIMRIFQVIFQAHIQLLITLSYNLLAHDKTQMKVSSCQLNFCTDSRS